MPNGYREKPAAVEREKEPSKWEQFFEYASDVSKGMLSGQAEMAKQKIKNQQKMKEIQMQYGLRAKQAQMQAQETQRRAMEKVAEQERLRRERPGGYKIYSTFREAEQEPVYNPEIHIILPVTGGYQIRPRTRAAGTTFFGETVTQPVLDYSTMNEAELRNAVQAGDTSARQEAVSRGYLKR